VSTEDLLSCDRHRFRSGGATADCQLHGHCV
jgi:hypothetical protein